MESKVSHPDPNIRAVEEANTVWACQAIDCMRKLERASLAFDQVGKDAWRHASLGEILSRSEIELIVIGALTALIVRAEAEMLASGRPTDTIRARLVDLDTSMRLLVDSPSGTLRQAPLEPFIYEDISRRTHLPRAEALLLFRGISHALLASPPKVWGYIAFKPGLDASLNLRLLTD